MIICGAKAHGEIVHNERSCQSCDVINDLVAQLKEMTDERDALLEK
jgi:hypothetical protein